MVIRILLYFCKSSKQRNFKGKRTARFGIGLGNEPEPVIGKPEEDGCLDNIGWSSVALIVAFDAPSPDPNRIRLPPSKANED